MTITLLKNFTVAMASGDKFYTDWISFPANHENAALEIHMQSFIGAATQGLAFKLESSFDTVGESQVISVTVLTAGNQTGSISSDLGPMVRLQIENADTVDLFGIVSVWLQPKST